MIRRPRGSLLVVIGSALLASALSFALIQAIASATALADDAEFRDTAAEVMDGFLLKFAPAPLLQRGPYRVLWAQWLGLPLIVLAAWMIAIGLSHVTRRLIVPIVRRTTTRWDDAMVSAFGAPLTLAWTIVAAFCLVPLLGLKPFALEVVQRVLRAFWFADLFWAVARVVDVASQGLAASAIGPGVSARRALMPLLTRVTKLIIMALAVITLLSELGFSVTSLVAGLGIGGLAVALAAQKTLEHWMGAISIAVDQPFREGDFIKVGDVIGTVEQIGMRSTRVRTLDRTVISIPNGKLAEMQPESFAPRDRIRLACNLKLAYGASLEQVNSVLVGLEGALRAEPKLWTESVTVRFKELADTAIVIEVTAWFMTVDWAEFMTIRQGMLLEFMRVIEGSGARFAFPGQLYELPHHQTSPAITPAALASESGSAPRKSVIRGT